MGSGNGQHDHRTCRDQDCERYACRIWHEAWREAWRDGHEDGYRQGYDVGFPDGIMACPRNHEG